MELSVIIVSFNVRDFLRQCLISVETELEGIDSEIFVVDNNSEDGSAEMTRNEFPDIKLIVNKVNTGYSKANNQAIRQSLGQYVLLLNPDTIVGKDTLRKCIGFMNLHPDAGALGVRMIDGDGRFLPESKRAFPTPSVAYFKMFGFSYIFPESPIFNKYYLPHIDNKKTSITEVISGAFMFIRRDALNKSGLLDEDFFMYGEDIDLSYRLLRAGYQNYYFPEAQIVHFKGKSTSRDSFSDIRHFYNAMRIYVIKRAKEGNYMALRYLVIPAICFREGIALANRFLRLPFRR
jgi:O-antigen biosynthesis protein